MSNFSANVASVRVDFFKEHGKWYTTEAVDMSDGYEVADMHKFILSRLPRREDGTLRYSGMWAVILEPHHQFSHPIMFKVPEI